MNVIIEARALSAKSGGVKSYTHELIKNITLLHPELALELIYSSKKPLGTFKGAKETVIPLRSEILLPFWMKKVNAYISATKPSVVHYTKAAVPNKKVVPTVVTIYDIIPILFPETQSPLRRLYWPYVLERAAKHADHIMTISEQSKKDIIEHFGTPEDKITVTPLAVDLNHFRPIANGSPREDRQSEVGTSSSPYILFVGTKDARKNISSLIRAFAQIADKVPHRLVIAGRPAKKQDDSMRVARLLHLESRVEFLENISYAELPALYGNADMFVWPSIYEGWGFPPQEAMACGTPVIVSNGGSLPEVVGDAGIIVPLDDSFIDQLAHEMLTLANDEAKKQELIQRGLARVQQFSWKDVAQKTYEVYKTLSV